MNRLPALPLLAAGLVACGDSAPVDLQRAAANGPARVIVADLDSAMNPYHEFFYAGSPIYADQPPSAVTPEVLAELGVPPENVIELTRTGNIVRDKKSDEAVWKNIRRGKPYWFKGTNLIGVSFQAENRLVPDSSKSPHGVGTSASVLMANPEAVILFVEVDSLGSATTHNFAFTHPAVDMITTSYGFSIPQTGFPLPEASAFGATWDGVVQMGKLHFSSGGNGSGSTPHRAGAGPWWSIGVSGIEEGSTEGDQQGVSGNFPDFVSDFTQTFPYCTDCERGLSSASGTSFSTPRAAGVASRVLLLARRALGHGGGIRLKPDGVHVMAEGNGKSISNWNLRRALEEAAHVPDVTDFNPGGGGTFGLTSTPVVREAAFLQIGWGDLTSAPGKGVVPAALAYLGIPGFGAAPEKGAGFCEFQTEVMKHRKLYWDHVALDSGDRQLPAEDPYVWCGSALPTP